MSPGVYASIPTEILQLIFSHFCLHCQRSPGIQHPPDKSSYYSLERHTLFSLCLASRRFCDIAQPILYHEFAHGYGDPRRSATEPWDGRLASFVQTVERRRDLAALVKWIYINPYSLESAIDNDQAQKFNGGKWLQHQSDTSDMVARLIAQLPNLEHLSLSVSMIATESIRASSLRAADVSSLPIKTLDIFLHGTTIQGQHDLFSLDYRARHIIEIPPGLETLNLHMCGKTWRRHPNLHPLPYLSNLKTLRITHSRLNNADLESLLSSCSALHTFVYEATAVPFDRYSCISMPFDGRDHFQAYEAVNYLHHYHRKTLKSLHLDLRQRDWFPCLEDRDIWHTFSFTDFPALEELFLNSNEIYGRCRKEKKSPVAYSHLLLEILPSRIKSLYLAEHIGNLLPHLVTGLFALADAVTQGRFPRLEMVRCDRDQKLDEEDEDSLRSIFAAAGVDFEYETFPLSEGTLGLGSPQPSPSSLSPMPLPDSDDPDL